MRKVSFFTLWDAIKELLTTIYAYALEDERKMKALREAEQERLNKNEPEEEEYLGI